MTAIEISPDRRPRLQQCDVRFP